MKNILLLTIFILVFLNLFSNFRLSFFNSNNKTINNITNTTSTVNQQLKITEEEKNNTEKIKEKTKNQINITLINQQDIFLIPEKIIEYTNQERIKNNLPSLKENEKLNISAEMKINDMFNKQYFDHYSPEDKGMNYFIKEANYEYLLIGENLAMGNFNSEKEIVDGWMNSLEHRKNILNSKFLEIGVAVREGILDGKKIWLAVQHFGTPISACPQPDKNISSLIDFNKNLLEEWGDELNNLKIEIEDSKTREEYNKKVEKYNSLVNKYNSLLETTKSLINQYNFQVDQFNNCMLKYK